MRFTIPVRHPDIWSSPPVGDALHDTLGFLSDDSYEFTFVRAVKPFVEREAYFPSMSDGAMISDEVSLFSGGIDSFAGAIQDLAAFGKNMVLVGHHSASKVFAIQKALIDSLKQRGLAQQLFYVPVNVTNTNVRSSEDTQRTRSFLFASLACVVARMFEKDQFTFYENGVVSLNLPIARDVLGGRATRTTHPRVIRGFEAIFSALLDRQIGIRTPFQWLTKKEVIQRICDHDFETLISLTNSCTRPRTWTTGKDHCGACSQCIDRRFAILAAGVEKFEDPYRYCLDLLTGDRSLDADVRMAVAYVKFFKTIGSSSRSTFISDNPQVTSALKWVPDMPPEAAIDHFFDLYQRQSEDVLSVVQAGLVRYSEALVRDELPVGSLLSLCFNRSQIQVPDPSDYNHQLITFIDGLSQPVCEFAVDLEAQRIRFRGGFCVHGVNFKLVNALVENHRSGKSRGREVVFIKPAKLAQDLGLEQASLRQQLTRLRKQVSERLAIDQGIVLDVDGFIENKPSLGYRLSPRLREVTIADLEFQE